MEGPTKKVFCTRCGAENAVGSAYCRNCGARLEAAMPAAAAPTTHQPLPQSPVGPYPRQVQIDWSRIPLAEIIVAICSLLVLIFSAQSWYKLKEYSDFTMAKVWPQWLVFAFSLLLLLFSLVMLANRYLRFIANLSAEPIYIITAILLIPTLIKQRFLSKHY